MGRGEMNSRAYVGAFGFKGGDQQEPVGVLSGVSATEYTSLSSSSPVKRFASRRTDE